MREAMIGLLVAVLAFVAAPAAAARHVRYDLSLDAIELRPGVTADLHATVFVNQTIPCNGKVAVAIHGMFHTAATWEPLVTALFDDNPAGRTMCGVVALDMPGRGGSVVHGIPWFGAVSLDDYVTATLGALDRLKQLNIRPDTAFGHSLGGLMVQLVQQRLIEEGRDLRRAYGVKDAVLLASATPRQVPSFAFDSGMLNQLVGSLALVDPVAGTVGLSDSVWSWPFFAPDPTNPAWVVPGAPTPAEVSSRHYNAAEPLGLLAIVTNRPEVAAGIFAPDHGTGLTVVSYQQDLVLLPGEARTLYEYLTGDDTDVRLVLVVGPESVHDTHVSNPPLVLDAIAAVLRVP